MKSFGLIVSGALLMSACASAVSEDGLPLTESPNYQVGYSDGCTTATAEDTSFSTEKTRDSYLFDNDRAYRVGWRQGYLSCGENRFDNPSDGGVVLGQENEY